MLDPALHAIWQKYHDRDYWGDALAVANAKRARDLEIEQGADSTTLPTDDEIVKFYEWKSQSFVDRRYAAIRRALSARDMQWLIDHARYDQPLTLDLFALASGYAFASGERSSNRRLLAVFKQLLKE